jgi:S1-C subfamily serine protease
MSNARYPWRILAIAAISIVGNVYLGYYLLFGLAGDGVDVADKTGRVVVTFIGAAPAERAGLAVGDVLSEINGQRIGTEVDWLAQRMNFEPDKPIAIRVERAGQPVDLK